MEMTKTTKKAGVLLGAIIAIVVVISGIFLSGMLKPATAEPVFPHDHLFVDATYLVKTDETNESVNITCDIYLTNIWEKASGDIKAIAYVIETKNNFAVFKGEVDIGIIKANSTAAVSLPVVLSNSSYKVDVLLFENDKLVIKGGLTITARSKYSWDEINHGKIAGGAATLMVQEWDVSSATPYFNNIR